MTSSGAIDATLVGAGEVDVETGSSSIQIQGIAGPLRARSRSGRIVISGRPGGAWDASTGSSSIEMTLDGPAGFSLDAASQSGSVTLRGASVQPGGFVAKERVAVVIGSDGPSVRANSRSGSVRIENLKTVDGIPRPKPSAAIVVAMTNEPV